jgi:phosphatidylglycerophosphatase A
MISTQQLTTRVFRDPHYFIGFGFGSGLLSPAPGTWGTLAAVPLYCMIAPLSVWAYISICLLSFCYGVWVCGRIANDLGVHDYKGIVWDEILGLWLTLFLVPLSATSILLGFILFRVFDILKPPPISWVDRSVTGGLGIMLDDVLAAIPAWLILQLLLWVGFL